MFGAVQIINLPVVMTIKQNVIGSISDKTKFNCGPFKINVKEVDIRIERERESVRCFCLINRCGPS
jgi:hypothetical protein